MSQTHEGANEKQHERDATPAELKALHERVDNYVFREGSSVFAADPTTHFGHVVLEGGRAVPIMDSPPHFEIAFLSGGQILAQRHQAAERLQLHSEDMVTVGFAEDCFVGNGPEDPNPLYQLGVATFQVDNEDGDKHLTYSVSVDHRNGTEIYTSSFEATDEVQPLSETVVENPLDLSGEQGLTIDALKYVLERHAKESMLGHLDAMHNLTVGETEALGQVMDLFDSQPPPTPPTAQS